MLSKNLAKVSHPAIDVLRVNVVIKRRQKEKTTQAPFYPHETRPYRVILTRQVYLKHITK